MRKYKDTLTPATMKFFEIYYRDVLPVMSGDSELRRWKSTEELYKSATGTTEDKYQTIGSFRVMKSKYINMIRRAGS